MYREFRCFVFSLFDCLPHRVFNFISHTGCGFDLVWPEVNQQIHSKQLFCWLILLSVRERCNLCHSCFREFPTTLRSIPAKRRQHTLGSLDELRLIVRGVVGFDLLVSKGDPFSRGFLGIDDYVLNVLSWMNSEVLIASSF